MGYSWDDIQPSYLGFSDGVQALIDYLQDDIEEKA